MTSANDHHENEGDIKPEAECNIEPAQPVSDDIEPVQSAQPEDNNIHPAQPEDNNIHPAQPEDTNIHPAQPEDNIEPSQQPEYDYVQPAQSEDDYLQLDQPEDDYLQPAQPEDDYAEHAESEYHYPQPIYDVIDPTEAGQLARPNSIIYDVIDPAHGRNEFINMPNVSKTYPNPEYVERKDKTHISGQEPTSQAHQGELTNPTRMKSFQKFCRQPCTILCLMITSTLIIAAITAGIAIQLATNPGESLLKLLLCSLTDFPNFSQ